MYFELVQQHKEDKIKIHHKVMQCRGTIQKWLKSMMDEENDDSRRVKAAIKVTMEEILYYEKRH